MTAERCDVCGFTSDETHDFHAPWCKWVRGLLAASAELGTRVVRLEQKPESAKELAQRLGFPEPSAERQQANFDEQTSGFNYESAKDKCGTCPKCDARVCSHVDGLIIGLGSRAERAEKERDEAIERLTGRLVEEQIGPVHPMVSAATDELVTAWRPVMQAAWAWYSQALRNSNEDFLRRLSEVCTDLPEKFQP